MVQCSLTFNICLTSWPRKYGGHLLIISRTRPTDFASYCEPFICLNIISLTNKLRKFTWKFRSYNGGHLSRTQFQKQHKVLEISYSLHLELECTRSTNTFIYWLIVSLVPLSLMYRNIIQTSIKSKSAAAWVHHLSTHQTAMFEFVRHWGELGRVPTELDWLVRQRKRHNLEFGISGYHLFRHIYFNGIAD